LAEKKEIRTCFWLWGRTKRYPISTFDRSNCFQPRNTQNTRKVSQSGSLQRACPPMGCGGHHSVQPFFGR
ncbi:MAG: hypothetical protein ABIL58_09560, partial [Pseudomonadota bacterium]